MVFIVTMLGSCQAYSISTAVESFCAHKAGVMMSRSRSVDR